MKAPEVFVTETQDPSMEEHQIEEMEDPPDFEMSPLLNLPAEILQNILFYMDSATYFTSLHSCRTIFTAAQSRRVALHHINRLPGLRLGLENLDNMNLFDSLRRRAAKGMCGAGVLANITTYAPTDDLHNLSKAVFSYKSEKHPLLATAHDYGQVHIYELYETENYVRLKAELRTETFFDDVFNRDYHMEILRMAFSYEVSAFEGLIPPFAFSDELHNYDSTTFHWVLRPELTHG